MVSLNELHLVIELFILVTFVGGFGVSTFTFTAAGLTMGGGSIANTKTHKEIATGQIRKKRIDLCFMKQDCYFVMEGVVFSFQKWYGVVENFINESGS
jgi:hypothetical protein